MRSEVYIKFPKTGLGNMLLVWARGVLFAHLNNMPYATSSWWGLRWGALLRRENRSRLYLGYFKETPFFKQWRTAFRTMFFKTVKEPEVNELQEKDNAVYVFNKVIVDEDLFGALRNHEDFIRDALYGALTEKKRKELAAYPPPVIGIHIRRGDFKLGNQTTPISFFCEAALQIRLAAGIELPITIFTDAQPEELSEILSLPNVKIAERKPDILDILLLAKSRILVLSKSSTFSYWGAFLSTAPVIRPDDDWQQLIKNNTETYREIRWKPDNLQAAKALSDVVKTYNFA